MLIFWSILYLDRTDEQRRSRERQYQDRHLYLDTDSLDAVTKAAVELVVESRTNKTEREILQFRHLFQEYQPGKLPESPSETRTVNLNHYVEDETGKELTRREEAELITGSPTAMLIPTGAEAHDIEFMTSERKPLPMAEVTLTTDEVKVLGYFTRDFRELCASSFMKEERPATIKCGGKIPPGQYVVETAATDEEIRSFVTILRRLYMAKEPANFLKAAKLFATALRDHPYGKWVAGKAGSYESKLGTTPDVLPFIQTGKITFPRSRLIEVFFYTQYAHQPNDKNSKPDFQREKQFNDCLSEAGGHKSVLTWMFLTEAWKMSNQIKSAGRVIARWFDLYCQYHSLTPDVLGSVLHELPGIGAVEKDADKRERLLGEKTQELAVKLWTQAGRPASGPIHFLHQAHDQLTKAMKDAGKKAVSQS